MKYISRDRLKFNVWGNLTRPVHDVLIHTAVYYKYNGLTYNRFTVDFWDNPCDWIIGKAKSYVLDWTIGRVLNYTNMNHPCPYDGHLYLKIDNISVYHFPFEPLLPAGRFRVDCNVTDTTRTNVLAMASAYLSVSDHRVERW